MRLSTVHKIILGLLFLALFVTGGWWAISVNEVQLPIEIFGLGGDKRLLDRESRMLAAHGIVAMVYLIAIGSLIPVHMKKGWHLKRKRLSGSFVVVLHAILIATAGILYYGSPDGLRPYGEVLHLWVGVVLPLAVVSHVVARVGGAQSPPVSEPASVYSES